MKYSTAQIHRNNMRRLKLKQQVGDFNIPRITFRKATRKEKHLVAKIKAFLYMTFAFIVALGVYTKFSYDFISSMKTQAAQPLISPVATPAPTPEVIIQTLTVVEKDEDIDTWIRDYAKQFANSDKPESYLKYQLHCLANKESGHRYADHTKCGDSGLSCGLYQIRELSWEHLRAEMKRAGLVTETGSLWDNKQATQTTAYALTHGYDMWWGPITRGQCQ